jgi:tyrosinase
MWGADAFGGNGTGSGSCVEDGRFANLTLYIGPADEDTAHCLSRAWNTEAVVENANSTALEMCNSYNTFAPWWSCISNIPHKGVHDNMGGVVRASYYH